MSSNCPGSQGGASLIVALTVVLVVVLLATRISSDYLVLFRSVENQLQLQQARAYLRGAETLAREVLLRDLQFGAEVDSPLEPWARPLALPLPEGSLNACLLDLQGRLNLNDLGASAGAGFTAAQKRFIRLLQVLDVEQPPDSATALALANAVFDWIDNDDSPRFPGGAEALDYLRLPQPYRPANQGFTSSSELYLVMGFEPALVAALTPHVSVWGNGLLNLNTLDPALAARVPEADGVDEAAPLMLRTLNNADSLLPLSPEAAALLASARRARGGLFEDLAFFGEGSLALQAWETEGLGLGSEFFLLRADMQVQDRHFLLDSVLHRTLTPGGEPTVTVRSRRYANTLRTAESACAPVLPR